MSGTHLQYFQWPLDYIEVAMVFSEKFFKGPTPVVTPEEPGAGRESFKRVGWNHLWVSFMSAPSIGRGRGGKNGNKRRLRAFHVGDAMPMRTL